ncbi:SusC/RagA family TonB-linked outer membrane protein [Sphingobacterium corticibacter]|uniref:SusC/RagA family TonB-linked outer membrane protein n=1 Tax=Sphingobacterium corticibacter TaxID=2171749 RepID=A0A2T8HLC7_9SPHI|nr:TonB-dependent receptor [Sphingobacterium corticibacter]PVH26193.1 SusC/RagA family TonB-linked outer membrane protein [Sphingobacterium corticibacter]
MKNMYNPDGRLWTALLAVAALSFNSLQAVPNSPRAGERTQITQRQEKVMGRVNDASTNEPISGVTITVRGTNVSTQTDENGQFTIDASNGQTLVATFLGYKKAEMRVSSTTVNFSLDTEGEDLEEVVVVGYGTMRKSDVTGSISIAKGSDMIKNQNFSALDNLRGQAAGVNVYSNSSQPGAYANRVVIRGTASINSSSSPLYVVDGVVMENFHLVNPNDIERMEVLKDASSAAIYGARGANGVIIVTTKRGSKDGRKTISYQGSASVSSPQRFMDVLNAEEWVQAFMIGLENENTYMPDKYNWSLDRKDWFNDPNYFDANGNPLYDTDWQREATRTALSQNHQLNIQQGDENSSMGAFINYTDQQGVVNNTYNKRVNGKLAYDSKVKDWLSTSINLTANHTFGRFTPEDGGGQEARRTMIEMLPWLPIYQPDGQYSFSGSSTVNGLLGFEGMSNPVSILDLQERRRANTQIFGNAALTFHLADGLDLKTQYGVDKQRRQYNGYSSVLLHNISRPNGWAQIENEDIFYWQQETYLSYNKQFNNHRINAVAGLSWQGRERNFSMNRTEGFTNDFFKWNNMAAGSLPQAPQSAYERWGMNSYFMRAAYTLNDKYSATVTGRYDGSSRFGANNKFGFFPSMGLAWVASNESFLQDVSWLNNLKLRSSFGITGNSEIAPYQSIGRAINNTQLLNGTRVSTSYLGNLRNDDLKWEKTATIDGGFELGLFQNRLNFDISYYNRRTTDLLLQAPLPNASGFEFVTQNIGAVNNRGFDIMISGAPVRNDNFQWTSTINMNYNKNKVVQLANNNADILQNSFVSGPNSVIRVGENLNSFYGYRRNGIFTVEDFENGLITREQIGRPNRSANQEILGKGIPDWSGSFINTFNYKNFDMTVDMQIVYGVETLQQFYHSTYDRFGITNGLSEILTDAYSPSNPNTMQQAIFLTNGGHAGQDTRIDSSWIVDGSFLRFNLIQVGYSFDASWAQRLGISGLRVYASANNPWVITSKDFKGYDPESTSTGDGNKFGQNVTFFSYPRAKTFTFGLNLTL